ncbi:T9SS type A sorting domain-containing protein [Limnovirga soli]|uniref:T9SS type A sorting domain-containing protein n=1 Tax=Limnovirga soli TaxID=2656915 RepID=A0A8J8FAT2_9BACT|nr:T9SS type A sorting domain-containing protein [Limnovirga soli]NNV54583.1 T9SS type A sorting domain-containing protein [Limnovirga soli]
MKPSITISGMRKQKVFLFGLYLLIASYLPTNTIKAQSGSLDKSFGENGVVTDKNYLGVSNAAKLLKDGKIIAAGDAYFNGIAGFFVAKYNSDGSIDSSFGTNGGVITDFPLKFEHCYAVGVQTDGKIIAGGTVFNSGLVDIALVRYNTNGSIDSSFGNEGLLISDLGANELFKSMIIQADDKIIISGNSQKNDNDIFTNFLVRYLKDGTLDYSFGDNGKTLTVFDNEVENRAVTLQKDGKIITGGNYGYLGNQVQFILVRFLENGVIDNEFGISGMSKEGYGNKIGAELHSLIIQDENKIIAGGFGGKLKSNMALMRFEKDGLIDTSFSTDGKLLAEFENETSISSLLYQKDGKIITAGSINPFYSNAGFAVARYSSNGELDSSFGTNGLTVTYIENTSTCSDALLQDDGKIILVGSSFLNATNENHFAFARYNNVIKQHSDIYVRLRKWLHNHGFSWENKGDNDIAYYAVERSNNGNVFKEISRIFNNTGQSNYEDNESTNGTNYYRLRAVGTDGIIGYSNTISINYIEKEVKLYPNPVKNTLHIEGLPTAEKTKLSIIDFNGNTKAITTITGNACNWNIAQLNKGNYMLKIEQANAQFSIKFIKE